MDRLITKHLFLLPLRRRRFDCHSVVMRAPIMHYMYLLQCTNIIPLNYFRMTCEATCWMWQSVIEDMWFMEVTQKWKAVLSEPSEASSIIMKTLLGLVVLCLASSSLCSEEGHVAATTAGAHAAAAEGHRDDKSLSATPSQQENVNIVNPDICLRFSSLHTALVKHKTLHWELVKHFLAALLECEPSHNQGNVSSI